MISYSPVCLKKAASASCVTGGSISCTPVAFLPSGSFPSDGGHLLQLLVGISVSPLHAKIQLGSWECEHHTACSERKFWGEWGGKCRLYPKKGEESASLAIRNCLMSNSDSAGAPQEILKKSSIHSWTACGINPHFPYQHSGKPSLITTLNRFFFVVSALGLCCHNKRLLFNVMLHMKPPL